METKIKKYITSLLTSTPLVMTIQQLDKDYRNTIGEAIPYQKLGYNTLEHFLTCIPDTIQVRGAGPKAQVIPVFSEKSAHVNELVTHQKVVNKKKGYVPVQRRVTTFLPSRYNQNVNNTETPVVSMPTKKMYYPKQKEAPPPSKCPSQSIDNCISRCKSNSLPNHSEFDSVDKKMPSLHSIFQNNTLQQTNLLGGVKKSEDSNRLEERKFSNSTAYVSSDTKVANNPKRFMRDLDKISAKKLEDSVPIQVRNNLRALIRQCPEGIWCAEIPEKYRKMFRCELDYQELGFKSLIHLCVCLSSIFHYARPSTEDYRLYDRSRSLPDCAEKTFTMASYGTNPNKVSSELDLNNALPNIDWVDAKVFLPPDIFPLGKEIPRTFVAHDIKENDDINVMVGEIYDLSKFWVYMADSGLDRLMDELQEFYKEKAQQYFIPDHLIMEGMYCVQIIFGEYHRALIVDTMPELEETIRVIFIDYGTMTKVSTKGLCFLHVKFSELQAQAIRCRLANVFPPEEGAPWSREACKAFRKMVVDRNVSAKINNINWEEQYLEIYLADVTNEDDIFYINDRLIEEGFAQPTNKARADPIINPVYTSIVKLIHLFPTFLELEHGLAPSTAEMEIFHECDIAINFCYPQYFYIDYSQEEAIIEAAERFHESYCVKGKRRSPSAQHFDLEYTKDLMLDLSVFGELQWEIEEFMNSCEKKDSSFNDDEFVDADEEHLEGNNSSDLNFLTQQLGELTTREEEAVNVLRRDLMMAEDIIKDISKICNMQPSGNNSEGDVKFFSFEQSQGGELRRNFNFIKGEWQDNETYWMGNESKTSADTINHTVIKKEVPDDVGNHMELSNHPLSAMMFDLPSEEENGSEFSGSDRNSRLSSEDYPFPIGNQAEIQRKNGSVLENKLFIDAESMDREMTVTMNVSTSQVKIDNCTNPFLSDLAAMAGTKVGLTKLNPNNPFLTYREDDKSSEGSSASTTYESPVMTTAQHSWTTFSDMSAETISLLGKSLCNKSCSGDSLPTYDPNCSRQTLDEQHQAVPVVERTQCDYFRPLAPSMPYCHPPWWANQSNNPYYSVHYANVQSYRCDAQYIPRPPSLPPPPGFSPQSRFPPAQPFQPVPQYAPQRPLHYYSGLRAPNVVMPPFQPGFNPTNAHCTNVSSSANSLPAPVAFNHVGAARKTRDFYDVYNEELRQRMNFNGNQ